MPSPESLELARLYFRKGSEDLDAAQILSDAANAADAVVGFHAQQAVEKFTKAVLVAHGIEVPRTHDLRFPSTSLSRRASASPTTYARHAGSHRGQWSSATAPS